jgi:hypothetical protein
VSIETSAWPYPEAVLPTAEDEHLPGKGGFLVTKSQSTTYLQVRADSTPRGLPMTWLD